MPAHRAEQLAREVLRAAGRDGAMLSLPGFCFAGGNTLLQRLSTSTFGRGDDHHAEVADGGIMAKSVCRVVGQLA
jgi:predicted short-subunit dehydrogenase-like oxidoreductase (DUF2520 family)